jgi:hypothetical protein
MSRNCCGRYAIELEVIHTSTKFVFYQYIQE